MINTKILHIVAILPAPLQKKKTENDILIRIAEEYQKTYPKTKHHFILCIPYSNSFLALFKSKWREYHELIKKGSYVYNGFHIGVIGMPAFKTDQFCRRLLSYIGYKINRSILEKFIHDVEPDLIHAHNLSGNLELAQILKDKYKINYIITSRGINDSVLDYIKSKYYTPSKILSINYISHQKCREKLDIPQFLIPHPIDEEFFVNAVPNHNNVEYKFISVCRLLKLKNIDKVLVALSRIDSPYIYDIYGSGPEEENLKQLIKHLNITQRVNFKGWVAHEDIKKVMKEYDLFLQPSYPETLGRVYFEAMASGVVVLASKNTGVAGIIKNGIEGYLVSHNDVNSIYGAIENFVGLPTQAQKKLKENALSSVIQYSWEKTLIKYQQLYEY